jgi:hypothetical protein
MHSSTSSSDVLREIPATRWPAAMVLAFVIFGATLGAWEAHWRAEWFVPSYRNSDGLWALTRDRIESEAGRGVAIVGSSRVLFDINLETWREVTGVLPIQLALEGTNPRPYLTHVAQETDFAGLVVVGVTEGLFFGPDAGLRGDVLKKFKERSPADRASQWLSMHLVERFMAFYDKDIALFTIVRRQPFWPDRARMTRPRPEVRKLSNSQVTRQADMWVKASDHEPYREVTRNIWRTILSAPRPAPPPPEVMQKHMTALFESVAADVTAIRARGGEVVFVRAPSAGPFREAERMGFPRERTWDPLLTSSNAAGIHFEDHADLQDFELPEWSHIRADQTDRFTRALLTHMRQALSARGTPRQEVER